MGWKKFVFWPLIKRGLEINDMAIDTMDELDKVIH
jgi:hypothetical protein